MAEHEPLERTIAALRAEVPVRAAWRAAVLREVDRLPLSSPVAPAARGWTLRPVTAIAAALLCAVLGGAVTLGVLQVRAPEAALATTAGVRFVLAAPRAAQVSIVGDFNRWRPAATPMTRSASGLWIVDLPLAAGRHTYAFVVDGVLTPDPNALDSADDDFGVPSSVVLVSDGGRT